MDDKPEDDVFIDSATEDFRSRVATRSDFDLDFDLPVRVGSGFLRYATSPYPPPW